MSLTDDQLATLRVDLQRLAGINYDPVLAELLDHYATLTEQHIAAGLSFSDASKWAWNDLGQGDGIRQIQDDYIANVQQQIRARHLTIVKSYFRWPAFLTTALVGVLVYLTVPMIPVGYVVPLLYVIIFSPSVLMLWLEQKLKKEPTSQRFLVFEYAAKHSHQPINTAVISASFWTTLVSDHSRSQFQQLHSTATVVVCLLLLLYTISFVQLLKERFDFRTKLA